MNLLQKDDTHRTDCSPELKVNVILFLIKISIILAFSLYLHLSHIGAARR